MISSSVSPSLSYSFLVAWWFDRSLIHSYDSVTATNEICCLLESLKSKEEITCGFEFHHYSLDRNPDFLVFSDTSALSQVGNIILPDWWSSFERFANCPTNKSVRVVPENWLEFDFVGTSLVLAGLWQCLIQNGPDASERIESAEDWDFICGLLCSSFFEYSALSAPLLKPTITHLSLPQQLGLMHARSNKLKLVYQCFSTHSLFQLDSLLHYFGKSTCSDILHITKYLRNSFSLFSVAVSIDIDFEAHSLSKEHIAFEIKPVANQSVQSLDNILCNLAQLFHISSSEVSDLYRVLNLVPYGQAYQFSGSGTYSSLRNVAKLNHLKFFYVSGAWHIKSYVKLIQQIS